MRSLAVRRREPEIMDQPALDAADHRAALAGLRRINRLSGSARIVWRPIDQLARELRRPIRILDVATGGGDVPVQLWRRARATGHALEIEGCDRSATALAYARENAVAHDAAIRFFSLDALQEPLPTGFDVICCSLFLHHLEEIEAVRLLGAMREAAGQLVLVNDLRRCWTGWCAAALVSRLLTRSHVVHVDAPLSVRGAFTCVEAAELARAAGMSKATIDRRWPWRWLLTWRKR